MYSGFIRNEDILYDYIRKTYPELNLKELITDIIPLPSPGPQPKIISLNFTLTKDIKVNVGGNLSEVHAFIKDHPDCKIEAYLEDEDFVFVISYRDSDQARLVEESRQFYELWESELDAFQKRKEYCENAERYNRQLVNQFRSNNPELWIKYGRELKQLRNSQDS